MKTPIFPKIFVALVGLAALIVSASAVAQNSSSQAAPTLSYGAANVLKLAQANVGEETILAYVEKSGQAYGNLGADEIIYLRREGVSDRVLSTMLAQVKQTRDETVAQQSVAQQTTQVATASQYQQTYTPPVTYVQTAPSPTVIYMRDSSPRLVDYGIYPRYSSYSCYPSYSYRSYGYHYPRTSFSIGFGGHHSGFSFHGGGFSGGYCR
jgi:hypothetical protein